LIVAGLDEALKVVPLGDNEWGAFADPGYESVNAMFGGWTNAVALNAVSQSAVSEARPSAITLSFVNPVPPGSDLVIRARRVGGSRSVTHWQAEVRPAAGEDTLSLASVAMTVRRETDGLVDRAVPEAPDPEAPDPEALEVFHAPGPQGQTSVIRPVTGTPAFGRRNTRSLHWVRDISGRRVDHLQLAYFADQLAPRAFFWSDGPRPTATITMSVFFHATDEEIDAVGDEYILVAGSGTRGERSTSGLRADLWSRQGTLLATSEQLAWFR
jgi:acyl-CoA thioesterase